MKNTLKGNNSFCYNCTIFPCEGAASCYSCCFPVFFAQVKLREMKPGMLSHELKEALGMPDGAPPPWLINMQVKLQISFVLFSSGF